MMNKLSAYAMILLGVVACLLVAREAFDGFSSGTFTYSIPKQGLTFFGLPALAIHASWFAIGMVFIVLGFAKLRRK